MMCRPTSPTVAREALAADGMNVQPDTREGQAGRHRVAERLVVPLKPGNAGRGKGPQFKTSERRSEEGEIGQPSNSAECSETTDGAPCQAKDEPGCRFHALYDKAYREDVLRHAYRCCCANHGAPGVDGVRFEDIEACGVDPWLGELAKNLKEKTYQGDAIRRVYIPKPNGKLRPLGIATVSANYPGTQRVFGVG
jgi:hypothetical protein